MSLACQKSPVMNYSCETRNIAPSRVHTMKSRLRLLLWSVVYVATFVSTLVIVSALLPALYRAASEANLSVCPNCGPGYHVQQWWYGLIVDGEFSPPQGPYGGCLITEQSPKWHCSNCGADWGHVQR
jgi:hypothetical protein